MINCKILAKGIDKCHIEKLSLSIPKFQEVSSAKVLLFGSIVFGFVKGYRLLLPNFIVMSILDTFDWFYV